MAERRLPTDGESAHTVPKTATVPTGKSRLPRGVNPQSALEPRTAPRRPQGGKATVGSKSKATGDKSPRKGGPVVKVLSGLFTLIVAVSIAVLGGSYYLNGAVNAKGPLAQAKMLTIPLNDGRQRIAERLEKEGVVQDGRTFIAGLYLMQLTSLITGGKPIDLKAGDYEIKSGASIRNVVETLSEGKTVLMRLTVPEGLTSYQIVERLKADQTLSGEIKQIPAEGTLLPETYSVPRGLARAKLIELMQAAQKRVIDQLWAERLQTVPLKTPEEALVLASIIEKETGRNDERDRVASVFTNRLRQKMPLQSDPTILYGLALGKVQWGKPILRSEIRSATAHNTYVIPALPPTPICNPGRAAIEAALKPAETKDLFFVADGKGGHIFAATNREHEANVAKWRQVEREIQARQQPGAMIAPASPTSQAPVQPTTINAGAASRPVAAPSSGPKVISTPQAIQPKQ
ncbi:MAG: endolytic transglycosylase MltG [Hyphomicrobiaceae bacterium]|nr:endolytic transglycosylase MltG [Hyphomicrobiaceae bacterium]